MLWFKLKLWFEQNQNPFASKPSFTQRAVLHKNCVIHKHHVYNVLAGRVQGLFAAYRIALSMVAGGTRRRRLNRNSLRWFSRKAVFLYVLVCSSSVKNCKMKLWQWERLLRSNTWLGSRLNKMLFHQGPGKLIYPSTNHFTVVILTSFTRTNLQSL